MRASINRAGDHDVDDEITEELRELEKGIGWGPFKDQKLIVWTERMAMKTLLLLLILRRRLIVTKSTMPCVLSYGTKGKHIIGVQTEKGGFNGEACSILGFR